MGIAVDALPDTNQEERQKDISEKRHSSDQNCWKVRWISMFILCFTLNLCLFH